MNATATAAGERDLEVLKQAALQPTFRVVSAEQPQARASLLPRERHNGLSHRPRFRMRKPELVSRPRAPC